MEHSKKNNNTVICDYDGESAAGTEFRRLLHNMLNSSLVPDDSKSFLITSATTGEGKSTISANLSVTAAIYKLKKTLLVDADLRRPSLHNKFDVSRDNGLSDILGGRLKLEDSFKSTDLENLWLLTSGTASPNPTKLFDSDAIHEIVAASKFYFDLILIDCAPVIPVSDPLLLGKDVDGILMVVKAGVTPREVCKRAADLIHESGSNLIGVAMNNMKEALPYYYNYRYYGYQYSPKK